MGGISPMTPGPAGWVLGVLLMVGGAAWLWFRFTGRRARAEAVAEVGPTYARGVVRVPQNYWHPSMGPRRPEPVTELLPRCSDMPDATLLIPRQRAASR